MERLTGMFHRKKADDSFFIMDLADGSDEFALPPESVVPKRPKGKIKTPQYSSIGSSPRQLTINSTPRRRAVGPPTVLPLFSNMPKKASRNLYPLEVPVLQESEPQRGRAEVMAQAKKAATQAVEKARRVRYPPAFPQLFPGNDLEMEEEKIEDSAIKRWFYQDDLGVEQGPFTSASIMTWIDNGSFDGRGSTLFRREDRNEFSPLFELLPYITRAQMGTANAHILKVVAPPLAEEKKTPEVEMLPEFGIPLDLTKLSLRRSEDATLALVPPDVDVIILPPRDDVLGTDVLNVLGVQEEGYELAYCQFESDYDWLSRANPAFSTWAKDHMIVGCEKTLVLPAHSIILKSASPIIMRALETQEKERRRREIEFVRTVPETEEYTAKDTRLQFLIRATHPEAIRLLIRRLYGNPSEFLSIEPILLACVHYEARRLRIDSIADETSSILARVTSLDDLVALTEIVETLEIWNLFDEFAALLCDSAFFVFSGSRYLRLGPLGFRKLLSSDRTSVDEIQLFIAAHLWLVKRQKSGYLAENDFWESFRRQPKHEMLHMEDKVVQKHLINDENVASRRSDDETKKKKKKEDADERETSLIFSNQVFIFSAIRFCQMSPLQLQEARITLRLDALLVDGVLRKLLGTQMKKRLVPWRDNTYYDAEYDDGGFPIRLIRRTDRATTVTSSKINDYHRRRKNAFPRSDDPMTSSGIPLPLSRPQAKGDLNVASWAWTYGDARPIAEASWGFEVSRTKNGRLSIGVASAELGGLIPNISIPVPSNGSVVWYFNLYSREFYAGVIINDFRTVHFRVSMTPSGAVSWTRSPIRGDIIVVKVSMGASNVRLTVQLFSEKGFECSATYDFGHHISQKFRGLVSQRPIMLVRPWVEMMDMGDTLTVPELHLDDSFFFEKP